ncbi:MAG: ABC transporter ATP-binding protein [Pirellulales bacterium]|nr:ABC transporter ATP-binding protein [Pirellulales bacterium]
MIEIIDFTKRYGGLLAVDRLTLKIAAGEVFGFIGPNGAGKSTTIRFLATLLRASEGDAIVCGHRLGRDPLAVRRSIGYMPDSFGFYNAMKVREFLDFFALAHRMPIARRRKAVDEALEDSGLSEKSNAPVGGLSRGMKQRLCLAKTLVHDPPVLILDEPANGLDPRARVELKRLLDRLRRAGKTILISSHVLAELADCCTSIGIIDRGRLLVHGPIEEVLGGIRHVRLLRVEFLENAAAGEKVLRDLDGLRDLRIDGDQAAVELAADDRRLAEILELLLASGARVTSYSVEEPTLEGIFMSITENDG